MARRDERIKMARPAEPEVVKTTIVGGQPPREGRSLGDVPRGVEVLIKKAAVDPPFKKLLLEKRAGAAEAIALTLSAAEAAMLEAVPEAQLRAIVANTKVSPGVRPAFLGYAAGAMLAALGAAAYAEDPEEWEMRTTGIDAEMPPKIETAAETNPAADSGSVSGAVTDENGQPISGVLVVVKGTTRFGTTNAQGRYEITGVPVGTYDVKASRMGFTESIATAITVESGATIKVNLQLPKEKSETTYITGIRPDELIKPKGE
jgi:hypothetical protein